jgi:hypothetical protein
VNQAYVIATSVHVDISGVQIPEHINDSYFAKAKTTPEKKEDETFLSTEKKVGRMRHALGVANRKTVGDRFQGKGSSLLSAHGTWLCSTHAWDMR